MHLSTKVFPLSGWDPGSSFPGISVLRTLLHKEHLFPILQTECSKYSKLPRTLQKYTINNTNNKDFDCWLRKIFKIYATRLDNIYGDTLPSWYWFWRSGIAAWQLLIIEEILESKEERSSNLFDALRKMAFTVWQTANWFSVGFSFVNRWTIECTNRYPRWRNVLRQICVPESEFTNNDDRIFWKYQT